METSERRRILFLGGALNQTRIAHAVAEQLAPEYDCWFSPIFADSAVLGRLQRAGMLEWTALGGRFREMSMSYLRDVGAQIDDGASANTYDLVVTTSDLITQRRLAGIPKVLLQEGMTDPETIVYRAVRALGLPRYLASTSMAGLSHDYEFFCVGSTGYRDLFERKGIPADRLVVTGIPQWDDIAATVDGSSFPHSGYALVATSDARETFKLERRMQFLRRAVGLAAGRPMIFKLHPNEAVPRATREILLVAPGARVLADGDVNPMVANCDVLITQYSTVVYTGMALGKECHSYFEEAQLRELMPMQNGGTSAARMAAVCREVLSGDPDHRRLVDVCACRDCRTGTNELHAAAG